MNCKEFERDLADWVAGRLPGERILPMESHRIACPACARAEAAERQLRALWRDLPALPEAPDIWPRLGARLRAPAPAPRSGWASRRVLQGALATALLLWALFWMRPLSGPPQTAPGDGPPVVDEARVVRLVAEMQRLPAFDTDPLLRETGLPWLAKRPLRTGNEVK